MDIKPKKLYTLVFVVDEEKQRLLLGLKKRGFGAGKINGFGGKVEATESIENAAIRELKEECGLSIKADIPVSNNGLINRTDTESSTVLTFAGINTFNFVDHPILLEVHIFKINYFDVVGEITESDEMKPEWFSYDNIPFDQMWPDDVHWFPSLFKKDITFSGYYVFESIQSDKLIKKELKEELKCR